MARKQPKSNKGGMLRRLKEHATGVMRALGKGHSERVYHRAMITSLNSKQIPHRSEVVAPVYFMGEVVGFGRCDIVVNNLVVEFKANTRPPTKTSPQLQKYLQSMLAGGHKGLRGVIINFNQKSGRVETHHEPPRRRPR
jgi:GxxExxY protein